MSNQETTWVTSKALESTAKKSDLKLEIECEAKLFCHDFENAEAIRSYFKSYAQKLG